MESAPPFLGGGNLVPVPNFFHEALGDAFQCFGCAPGNPSSLRGKFYAREESQVREVLGFFPPAGPQRTSFPHLVHGGILSSIIDDSAYWTLFHHCRVLGVTTEMNVKYLAPCPDSVNILAVGTLHPDTPSLPPSGSVATVNVEVYNEQTGKQVAKGQVKFFLLPKEKVPQVMGTAAVELLHKL